MKKHLLFAVAIVCFSVTTQAQITKGSLLVGGNLGLIRKEETTSLGNGKSTYWNIRPTIGLAVKDNTLAGISLIVSGSSMASSDIKSNADGGGIFLRKYKPLGKGFYLLGEANALYVQSKFEVSSLSGSFNSQRFNTGSINLFPGVSELRIE